LRRQRKKAEIQALIEREKRLVIQAQKDAVSATLIESNQGPVVPQPLQEAIAATPTGRIQAHEVQPPALQDAVSATPTRSIQANEVQVISQALQDAIAATPTGSIQAMKCKRKLYKTQFLPLLVRILKSMRCKYKIYKTQFLPPLVRILKPMRFKCKIYKTQEQ
jgi:hypothetical protein